MKKSPAAASRPKRSNVRIAYDAVQAEVRENELHLARLSGRSEALEEMRKRLTAMIEADRAETPPADEAGE